MRTVVGYPAIHALLLSCTCHTTNSLIILRDKPWEVYLVMETAVVDRFGSIVVASLNDVEGPIGLSGDYL